MIGFICVMHKCNKCSRNTFNIINNFIDSLYKFCNKSFKLYLFDNESDEEYNIPNYPNIIYEYIEDQSIYGLPKPINDGIKKAIKDNCSIIIILNDDIILNKTINDFIDIIENHRYNDIGMYGPLTNGMLKISFQRAEKSDKGIQEITNENKPWGILNGFCIGFTKEFYERFKLPDGNLFNMTLKWCGGELDLHNRIKPLGARMFIIKECWLYHIKFREWKTHT